jgi:hypothetical protein
MIEVLGFNTTHISSEVAKHSVPPNEMGRIQNHACLIEVAKHLVYPNQRGCRRIPF